MPAEKSSRLWKTCLQAGAILLIALCPFGRPLDAEALEPEAANSQSPERSGWYRDLASAFGGHFKAVGRATRVESNTLTASEEADTDYDGSLELRLKDQLSLASLGYIEAHYEALFSGGDTRKRIHEQESASSADQRLDFRMPSQTDDRHRLMDLTGTVTSQDDHILYHRLDRLFWHSSRSWGDVRIGRQALTWGNGRLFNPLDLFNPFAPTDVDREYKTGDDMAWLQIISGAISDIQMVYVPRRDPQKDHLAWNQSSLAAKLHLMPSSLEIDLMAAAHYDEPVLGLGSVGTVGGAVWRADTMYTFLGDADRQGFMSFVVNLDYSWVWRNMNHYGLVEFYYNELGETHVTDALASSALLDRMTRGDIYTTAKAYLGLSLETEWHPLFRSSLRLIHNLCDGSGLFMPQGLWDFAQNWRATLGAYLYYGAPNTEYGGFSLPGQGLKAAPADSLFVWLTYYF